MTPPEGTMYALGDGLPAVEYAYHPEGKYSPVPLCARCADTMAWMQANKELATRMMAQSKDTEENC